MTWLERYGKRLSVAGMLVLLVVVAVLVTKALSAADPVNPASLGPGADATPTSRPTAAPGPGNHLAYGDLRTLWLGGELTQGVGASTQSAGYHATLVRDLGQLGTVTQTTTSTTLADYKSLLPTVEKKPAYDLVVVDLGDDTGKLEVNDFRKYLGKVVFAARDTSPDAVFLCVGSWRASSASSDVDDAIKQVCSGAKGVYVPLADLYDEKGSRGPATRTAYRGPDSRPGTVDATLPNDFGYARIADRLLLALDVDFSGVGR